MPAVSSTRTRTRCRAGCTGSACRWSTRCRRGSTCGSSATARNGSCASTTACPRRRSPSWVRRRRCRRDRDARSRPAPRSPFCRAPRTFTKTEFDFTTLEHRLRELAFLNSGVTLVLTDLREAEPKTVTFHYDGGLEAFVHYLDRSKQALHAPPIAIRGERDGIIVEIAMEWTNSYHETMLCFTNNIPQRDGGTHLAGFRGGADPHRQRLCQRQRHRQEGEGGADRRGHARRLDLHPLGQDARPEILVADQGQAGLLRGPAGDRGPGRRPAAAMVRGTSGRGQKDHRQGRRGGGGARGGAQGARPDPPQDRARHLQPAGQARRLPGARPGQERTVHRRGRQRRRLGQAGPRPRASRRSCR